MQKQSVLEKSLKKIRSFRYAQDARNYTGTKMKKLKVAEVITRMDWGGAPDIVRITCGYLNPDFYDITLITGPSSYPSAKTEEFMQSFRHKIIIIPELKREINPISDLAALIRLYFLFRRSHFDVVHTHTAKVGALGRIAAALTGKSIIIHTPHGHNFYGYFGPLLSRIIAIIEKFLAYFTDKIIALTELEKKDLIRFKVADAEKISLIYPGLELDRHLEINIEKDRMKQHFNITPHESIVGAIGRLEPVKGLRYFIEAAKEIAGQSANTKFIIVGEGSLRQKLQKQVKEAGLENKFIFTGWREDTPEILSILDILVLPSLNEAVGMILIEAQAVGVPIVASNVGGIPEVIRDGQTGILVPPGDPHSLARAINQLLADKQKRLNMSEAARAWIKDKFKPQDMADAVSSLYQELVSNRK
jgi:glycosyltransferase involved in cell wall biosynthesis